MCTVRTSLQPAPSCSLREHIEDYTSSSGFSRGRRAFALLSWREQIEQAYQWLGFETFRRGLPFGGSVQTEVGKRLVGADGLMRECGMTDQWELICEIPLWFRRKRSYSEFIAIALDGTVRVLTDWRGEAVIVGRTIEHPPFPTVGIHDCRTEEEILADEANERYYRRMEGC
jgi:hypothetical protein